MATINFHTMIKPHFVDTRFLSESLLKNMFWFFSIFFASVYTFILKISGFISKSVYRSGSEENGSNFSVNRSQNDDQAVSESSPVFLPSGLAGKDLQNGENDLNGNIAETEDSVSLQTGLVEKESQDIKKGVNEDISETGDSVFEETEDSVFMRSGLISGSKKYQFLVGENVSECLEEPKTEKFTVQEMFVGSGDVLEKNRQEFCEESEPSSFCFKLLNPSIPINGDIHVKVPCDEQVCEEKKEQKSAKTGDFSGEDEILEEDKDFSYEVELLPTSQFSAPDDAGYDKFTPAGSSVNWMNNFLDETDQRKQEDLDDVYIELEPHTANLNDVGRAIIPCGDAHKAEELNEHDGAQSAPREPKTCRGSGSDDDDEEDVLWEHQNLVQQMKMELKNCRVKGLPTISEECETPKMIEDLKPLKIDHKIEYKDIMDEIHKFYKSYLEKIKKLDILNYQTLHAISFLQLKDSEIFTTFKKTSNLAPFVLPKIWTCKGQRIYADPAHKTFIEMHRDLELVYVGQLCLSSEILCWLYVKVCELQEYESKGSHSYNRAAEEFQQFQVLIQRFMEDEPFQGQRIQNYVKSRCLIRSLLQVPTIKDDCLKTKKERREETDAISLEQLLETIRESMLIFRDFLFADKIATNVASKGVQGTKIHLQNTENSELLVDIVTNLQKKERRIKEQIRSQSCIVKKLKKHNERRLSDEIVASQMGLRLVSRVLSMSRLTTDQLVWCQKKLENIHFVRGKKVRVEPSFLLFPC